MVTPVGEEPVLVETTLCLIDGPDLRAKIGQAARLRASQVFASIAINEGWRALYRKLRD